MFDTSKFTSHDISSLYKWHKNYGNLQKRYFKEDYQIRREKQIEDFIELNDFGKIKIEKDNYILESLKERSVDRLNDADLCVITDQTFSRYPCPEIIKNIEHRLEICSAMYLCLNRYYINIDNSFHDKSLSDNPNLAITQWLKKSLPELRIIDLSLDYDDDGAWFTWVIPDRHYFIESNK
jgi:hypothetical protein